ncbi:hypothetical protein [Nonomuraea jabiensis]|uniref:hypothetical protein n=1 Tax=Nonomuraea jabiensis TaxID=882448 RepID=UPI003D73993A
MLAEALSALAATAATTLVGAMATDGWESAKSGFSRLFSRRGQAELDRIDAQLDTNAGRVARKDEDRVRQALIGVWQLEVEDLLEEHPELAGELRDLVTELQAGLPEKSMTWVQNNIARDHGRLFAAQGGNVIIHGDIDDPAR